MDRTSSSSHRLIASCWSRITICAYPTCALRSHWGGRGVHVGILPWRLVRKNWNGLANRWWKNFEDTITQFDRIHKRDRQMDGQTNAWWYRSHLHSTVRPKPHTGMLLSKLLYKVHMIISGTVSFSWFKTCKNIFNISKWLIYYLLTMFQCLSNILFTSCWLFTTRDHVDQIGTLEQEDRDMHESGCRILPTQLHMGAGDFQVTNSIEL